MYKFGEMSTTFHSLDNARITDSALLSKTSSMNSMIACFGNTRCYYLSIFFLLFIDFVLLNSDVFSYFVRVVILTIILSLQWPEAVECYRNSMRSWKEHEDKFKTDSLQVINIITTNFRTYKVTLQFCSNTKYQQPVNKMGTKVLSIAGITPEIYHHQ